MTRLMLRDYFPLNFSSLMFEDRLFFLFYFMWHNCLSLHSSWLIISLVFSSPLLDIIRSFYFCHFTSLLLYSFIWYKLPVCCLHRVIRREMTEKSNHKLCFSQKDNFFTIHYFKIKIDFLIIIFYLPCYSIPHSRS